MAVPLDGVDRVELKALHNLRGVQRARKVLLVRVHQDCTVRLLHLVVGENLVKLYTSLFDSIAVAAVHYVDESVGSPVVMVPQSPDLVLAAHISHRHVQLLVRDVLYVKTNGRNGVDALIEFQRVEEGGLACERKWPAMEMDMKGEGEMIYVA